MTKYFIEPNDQYPDSAHNFWLRKDQYTIGELLVSEDEAQHIAKNLNDVPKINDYIDKLEGIILEADLGDELEALQIEIRRRYENSR